VDEQDQSAEQRSDREGERSTAAVLAVIYAVAAAEVIVLCGFLWRFW
jgi:hypothetical protein